MGVLFYTQCRLTARVVHRLFIFKPKENSNNFIQFLQEIHPNLNTT
jgi:hypothetical protein